MAAEEFIKYLLYICHHKIDTEYDNSYQEVQTWTFTHHNKKIKLKETILQLPFH